jgi:hypothetical protein
MTDEPFPSSALDLAEERNLGDPVRAFRPHRVRRLASLVLRRVRREAVYLFEHGLVRYQEAYRWDELRSVTVAGVRRRREGRTRWRFGIQAEGRRTAEFDYGLSDMERLVEVIMAEVMKRVVPGYVATIESGGKVVLGPFTVSGKGLEKDAEMIPWPYVQEVGMSNGLVYVSRHGQAHATAVIAARMPNAAAFIALCRHLGVRVAAD